MNPADADLDTALDAELSDLLDVDPSPHFVSRVRARVAAESRDRTFTLRWALVPGAVAAAAVFALALWPATRVDDVAVRLPARNLTNGAGALPAERSGRIAPPIAGSLVPPEGVSIALIMPPRSYNVIIDPAESATLMRLVENAGAPPPEPRPGIALARGIEPLTPLDPIDIQTVADIQPLVIEPLAMADEGVFQ
jgi:hypothetical protein